MTTPDGASAVLLMSESRARDEGRELLTFIEAIEYAAIHPTRAFSWHRAAMGGRILTTLAYEMARRQVRRGLISICAAGGMAGAFLLTRD